MIDKFLKPLTRPHLLQRIWRRIMSPWFFEQWIILIAPDPDETPKWENFKRILPPPDRDWADPFLWVYQGKYFLFIEEKLYSTNLGRIICLTLDENMSITSSQVVLERPYHLSYPFLFEYQDQLYMIPESNQNNTIDLYRCTNFPSQWVFEKTLMSNIKAVDTTLVEKDGKWWLFANVVENGGTSWDTLHLYSADHPTSDQWMPHPKNPIIKDINTARPAGNFQLLDGLIRPSQDCSVRYGFATNFNRVTILNETDYKEIRTNVFKPSGENNLLATHTWNKKGRVIAIDAILRRRRPTLSKFPAKSKSNEKPYH